MIKINKAQLPIVLSIAGTDPSAGAGIQADLKAISATGSYGVCIITAVVSQNTQGVRSIFPLPTTEIEHQCDSIIEDLEISAIKIGMLFNKTIIDVIANFLKKISCKYVIIDPVMIAKNGAALLAEDTINHLKQRILTNSYLLTPNIFEAEQLLGESINSIAKMKKCATIMGHTYNSNILIKGGHMDGSICDDVLYNLQQDNTHVFHGTRINTKNTHGTGCSLSSAIASYMAQGFDIIEAVFQAKQYIEKAIAAGKYLNIGLGNGPLDHFYFMRTDHA